ncbi:MAG: hypothetical protein AB7G75_07610 [Candidatus Binatia bacterium]
MGLTLENISMATARELVAQATANGLTVETYLQRLLGIVTEAPQTAPDTTSDEHTNAFMADMEMLAEDTDQLPSAQMIYSREDIYFDHD